MSFRLLLLSVLITVLPAIPALAQRAGGKSACGQLEHHAR